jgi:hypothetical protein
MQTSACNIGAAGRFEYAPKKPTSFYDLQFNVRQAWNAGSGGLQFAW